jgi:hypothetical protein
VYRPADPEHERVDCPLAVEPVSETLVGDRAQAKPEGGELAAENDIVPANPWSPIIVIVEVPVALARSVTLVGLAAKAKSCTVYETETE